MPESTSESDSLVTRGEAARILGLTPEMVTHLTQINCLLRVFWRDGVLILEREKVMNLLEARRRSGFKTPDSPGTRGGRPSKNGKAPHGN
jgi:hypothetical protein